MGLIRARITEKGESVKLDTFSLCSANRDAYTDAFSSGAKSANVLPSASMNGLLGVHDSRVVSECNVWGDFCCIVVQ